MLKRKQTYCTHQRILHNIISGTQLFDYRRVSKNKKRNAQELPKQESQIKIHLGVTTYILNSQFGFKAVHFQIQKTKSAGKVINPDRRDTYVVTNSGILFCNYRPAPSQHVIVAADKVKGKSKVFIGGCAGEKNHEVYSNFCNTITNASAVNCGITNGKSEILNLGKDMTQLSAETVYPSDTKNRNALLPIQVPELSNTDFHIARLHTNGSLLHFKSNIKTAVY